MHQTIEFNAVPMFPVIKPTLTTIDRDVIVAALDKLIRAQPKGSQLTELARSARLQLTEQTPTVSVRLYARQYAFINQ